MNDFGQSGIEALIYIGLILKVMGFLVRDELALRSLVTMGMICDILFYALRPDPIVQSMLTNFVMASINAALIGLIVFERTTLSMTTQARQLFRHFSSLTPGHFRILCRHVTWQEAQSDQTLLTVGQEVRHLYFVMAQYYTIEKHGARFTAKGPAFVGEIALLSNRPSTATVTIAEGTRYATIPFDVLQRRMNRSKAFKNSMVAVFAEDLANKVAFSVPISQRDETSQALHGKSATDVVAAMRAKP